MTNNDATYYTATSEKLIELIRNKSISNDIKNLMEIEEIDYDEHGSFDEGLIDALVKLCEVDGKITPRNTVAKLEGLMFSASFKPNTYFIDRYAYCLSCSCRDQDENYIQDAVDKLRLIIQNADGMDTSHLIAKYIACLSMLSAKQKPEQAKQTIFEMEFVCDETDSRDNPENLHMHCVALHSLCLNQSRAGDLQGALGTLEILESIIDNSDEIEDINILLC